MSDELQQGRDIFWAEINPSEHLVQFYENDGVFMDTLEGFIGGGIRAGDGVIVIATPAHLKALESRLRELDVEVDAAREEDRYIALDAEETLQGFMRNGWPDDALFARTVTGLITRAQGNGRKVRAFGEMVAVLWAQGYSGATVRLEYLWHELCQKHGFSLFCAYPRTGFTQDAAVSIREICAAHSKMVGTAPH